MATESVERLTTINRQEKAALIWAIADKLVGVYKPHEYGNVILPMCVIKRFEDTLAPTRQVVWDKENELKDSEIIPWKQDIDEFLDANVRPYAPDFWYVPAENKIGYEIPFTREFYRYTAPKSADEIFKSFVALGEREKELMNRILGGKE